MTCNVLFLSCLAVLIFSVSAKIPSYIKICTKNDPNLAQCITDSVNQIRPKLMEGIPELGVPSVDPLSLGVIQLRSGPNQAKIDANITNVKVWGPSKFEIISLRPNLAKNQFIFRANIPNIYFEGDYDIDMHILILKYKGQGPIKGNFTNYMFDCVMRGDLYNQNGQKYLKFRKFGINLHLGKSFIMLENLFPKDPTLAKATNAVIEENSDLFVNEIKPVLEDSLATKFTEIANTITKQFTYDELFPAK